MYGAIIGDVAGSKKEVLEINDKKENYNIKWNARNNL